MLLLFYMTNQAIEELELEMIKIMPILIGKVLQHSNLKIQNLYYKIPKMTLIILSISYMVSRKILQEERRLINAKMWEHPFWKSQ